MKNRITTNVVEKYGDAKIIARYDADTSKFINYKVYDENRHVKHTTTSYEEAHDKLLSCYSCDSGNPLNASWE